MSPTQNSQNYSYVLCIVQRDVLYIHVCMYEGMYKQFYKPAKMQNKTKQKNYKKCLTAPNVCSLVSYGWLLMSNVAHFAYQTPGVNGGRVVAWTYRSAETNEQMHMSHIPESIIIIHGTPTAAATTTTGAKSATHRCETEFHNRPTDWLMDGRIYTLHMPIDPQ